MKPEFSNPGLREASRRFWYNEVELCVHELSLESFRGTTLLAANRMLNADIVKLNIAGCLVGISL